MRASSFSPLLLVCALGLPAMAPTMAPTMAAAQDTAQHTELGADHYLRFCSSCHGADAQGKGPMAPVLLVQPADLTALAAGNDGVFPTERVVMRIDGRDPLVSHGSPMPVYGPFFEGQDASMKTPAGQPILTSQPIVDLVAYLESIQRP